MRRHSLLAYSLYTAGRRQEHWVLCMTLTTDALALAVVAILSADSCWCTCNIWSGENTSAWLCSTKEPVVTCRFCHICVEAEETNVHVPVWTVCLDTHDSAGGVHPLQLLRQQHIRWPHVVPVAVLSCHH